MDHELIFFKKIFKFINNLTRDLPPESTHTSSHSSIRLVKCAQNIFEVLGNILGIFFWGCSRRCSGECFEGVIKIF